MSRRLRLLGVSAIVAGVAGAAIPATALAVPVITMSGSTSVAPLASLLAKAYLKQYPGRVKFKLAQGGSDVGVADVAAGRVSIGNSSRDPKSARPGRAGLQQDRQGRDLRRHQPGQPAGEPLPGADPGDLLRPGAQLGGRPGRRDDGPINLVVRTAASGTQDAFQKIFMGSSSVFSGASAKASNGLVQQPVTSDQNAIGYVSLDFVKGTNAVAYKGVGCTLRNAKSGEYGGVRNFWMVTRGHPRGQRDAEVHPLGRRPRKRAQKIVGEHWVPLI